MIERIISGGQTGADQAGLRAGRALGIPVGGTAPQGYLTEDGPNPGLGTEYGLTESTSSEYPLRTYANARDSDGTIRFAAKFGTPGERLTLRAATLFGRPHIDVNVTRPVAPDVVAGWVVANRIAVLNVAGNKESTHPGIGEFVEGYLCAVVALLRAGG